MRKYVDLLRAFAQSGLGDKASKTAATDEDQVDCNLRDDYTPLMREIKSGNMSAVQTLLANIEVNPNLQDSLGRSPLH
jgi:ankyrin repeat protein